MKWNARKPILAPLSVFLIIGLGALAIGLADGDAVAAAPTSVMSVPAKYNVSKSGAFTYSIPIRVPPGTAGIAPSLSLDYSSQNADGFEGWGWSLSGIPSITRCPRSLALDQDNNGHPIRGGVNYNMDDRFCLNGQRLMLVANTGAYGADGSQYKTQVYGFELITAHGAVGNGPASFEVHAKSGQIFQMGDNANSRAVAVGNANGTIREWRLHTLTDKKGNYLSVTYNAENGTDRTAKGEIYPTRIDYTGNASKSLSPYNSVQFGYTTRSDSLPTYQAGSILQINELLSEIKTYNGSTLVLDYKLGYRPGSATAHSRMTSVKVCDTTAGTNCLAETDFGWQGGDTPVFSATSNTTTQSHTLFAGDFNGDGLTDAGAYLTSNCPSGGALYSGTQQGTFSAANDTATYSYFQASDHVGHSYQGPVCFVGLQAGAPYAADFFGDRFTHLILNEQYWYPGYGGDWLLAPFSDLLKNDRQGAFWETYFDEARPRFSILGDFDGDGRTDGLFQGTASGMPYFSQGNGQYIIGPTNNAFKSGNVLYAGDFDGDGCTDVLTQGATNAIVYSCNPAVTQASVSGFSGQIAVGDFNGDGKSDVLVIGSTGANIYLATGTGLSSPYTVSSSSTWHSYTAVVGDWTGDGKSDVALISNGGNHLIYQSTGTDFSSIGSVTNSTSSVTGVVADWNSDGADDLWLKSSGDVEVLFTTSGKPNVQPEMINSVDNNIGATIAVTYDRLNTNGSFYAKATDATYSTADVDGPYYVVSRIDSANGVGGTYGVTYACNLSVLSSGSTIIRSNRPVAGS